MVKKQLITGPAYTKGLGGRVWSPGIKVGPWLFLSGVTAVDYKTMTTVGATGSPAAFTSPKLDPEAQWRQVLS
ncbi:MAG TPA: hypothetical protein VEW91_09230, partial [bacterium]|nr:hypothetical protein [bacterium]